MVTIYSVFHQIEALAAQELIDHGQARKIEQEYIPKEALYNDAGKKHFSQYPSRTRKPALTILN